MLHNKSNSQILEELNEKVYGHIDAKKSLINLVNRSKMRHYQKWGLRKPEHELVNTHKCLLVGGSGTGKTFLVHSLAEIVSFPYLCVDASQFNPTGAHKGIQTDDVKKLIFNKVVEYKKVKGETYFSEDGILDQMIVFVDEFDKLSSHYDGSSNSWQARTQSTFLTLFENNDILSSVSWIFAGAFSGMKEENKTKSMGFNTLESHESNKLNDEDLVKYGLIPEMVGRINSICELDKLTEQDYYNILINKILPEKEQEMQYFNYANVAMDQDNINNIIKKVSKSNQGVRYLKREVDKYFRDLEFNYEEKLYLE